MSVNSTAASLLFDRVLLRARQRRSLKLGAETFLLERVAEDMAERLQAVLRTFAAGADVGTPGDQARHALANQVGNLSHVDLPDIESEGLALQPQSLDLAV